MKGIVLAFGLVVALSLNSAAQQSYLLEYESTSGTAGWFKSTINFNINNLSISQAVLAEGGNHYGHDVETTLPSTTVPSSRWFAGCSARLGSFSNPFVLPTLWRVDFDVRRDVVEPIWVELQWSTNEYIGWVTPSSTGWEHLSLTSDQFTVIQAGGTLNTMAYLDIGMASHDAFGNPLEIYNPGTYTMDIDNVAFGPVPEPGVGLMALGAVCLAKRRGK